MKTYFSPSSTGFRSIGNRLGRVARGTLLLGALLPNATPAFAADTGRSFATPEAAVQALMEVVNSPTRQGFVALWGDDADRLANPDTVQGQTETTAFAEAFKAANRLVTDSDTRRTLEVGPNRWPFPIPLVKSADGWRFDTAAGVEELLNRRIGRNELDVLRVIRAYVQAQREYAAADRDGDQVREYAQLIRSTPGQTDGLFWPPELNGEISPLGPLVAFAQDKGYVNIMRKQPTEPEPFHGYFFRVLKAQGRHAPGGKHNYVINGNMIAGFGLVAWPAEYGNSGVMTFIVNQQGRVFEKDLGPKTARIAAKLDAFDPSPGWRVSTD